MLRNLFSLFPAHAGVIPWVHWLITSESPFPRTCGGDPVILRSDKPEANFSPHMRG